MPPRALSISTVAAEHDASSRMGDASYSYYYVYRAFEPLLERWDHAPLHLGFVPLDAFQPISGMPNAAFPFWDFPDVLDAWADAANALDLLLVSSDFTRDAFLRAGVRTPIRVVRVPVRPELLALPPWQPGARVVIDAPSYVVPPAQPGRPSPAKSLYQRHIRPRLPRRAADALRAAAHEWSDGTAAGCATTPALDLSGIVYTTILNPFDQRKNWPDLVSAFLFALRDRDDATLVVKLALPPDRSASGVNKLLAFHRRLGIAHRCKLVLVSAYLSDAQMLELARGSAYYVNASRAEGACLPLQDFLAAGRPAVAPSHTALADFFDDRCGFVVESHPEPTVWPQDPERGYATTWHRLVWTSLHDRIRESYDAAATPRYETLAAAARARMAALAGSDVVWTQLCEALDSLVGTTHAL
jgi:glycosyltransferase involved in cell wall biosynthesis